VSAIPMLAFILFVAAAITGRNDLLGWQSHGLGAGQVTAALLVICLLGWTAVSVALLIPITLGLVQRQRTRKTLVRVGRARSWAARPGDNGRGKPATAGPRDLGEFDEDRIVERVADFGASAPAGFDATASGMGGSIFGGGGASRGPSGPGPSAAGPSDRGPGNLGGPGFGGSGAPGGLGGPGGSGAPGGPGSPGGPGGPGGPGFGGPGLGGPTGPGNPNVFGARGGLGNPGANPGSIGGPALARPPAGNVDAETDDRAIGGPGFGAPRSPGFGGPGSGDPIG